MSRTLLVTMVAVALVVALFMPSDVDARRGRRRRNRHNKKHTVFVEAGLNGGKDFYCGGLKPRHSLQRCV